jgi:hypothetical protein
MAMISVEVEHKVIIVGAAELNDIATVFCLMLLLLSNRKVNTTVFARQLQVGHFHGYTRWPGTVVLGGNQQ